MSIQQLIEFFLNRESSNYFTTHQNGLHQEFFFPVIIMLAGILLLAIAKSFFTEGIY